MQYRDVVREFGMPMQPGEPSWASEKCGGGPHTRDMSLLYPEMGGPVIKEVVLMPVQYVGTEVPEVVQINQSDYDLPA